MKIFSKVVLLTLFLFSMSAYAGIKVKADETLLFISGSSNQTSSYVVKNKTIADLPEWNGDGVAPLSNDDATKLALNKHKEKYGKAKLRSISLKSKKTHCDKGLDCAERFWYYKVKVKGEKKKTYVILMDGSFVKPKTS